MKNIFIILINCWSFILIANAQEKNATSATVPFTLDHNRMLVVAELQRTDGSWRKARLWVDSGSTAFFISESLARDLGIDLSVAEDTSFKSANLEIDKRLVLQMGGKELDLDGVLVQVKFQPYWLFSTMLSDGNLPATVLSKYHIIFDYPKQMLTIADKGSIKPTGIGSPMHLNPQTGIVQLDATIEGINFSFALDNGASYSFISDGKLAELKSNHPEWPIITGTIGCANMWGWWPSNEQFFTLTRISRLNWENITLQNVGIAGVPDFQNSGKTLGEWYSQKTLYPVDGFLGANVLKAFRIEIDYANQLAYFEKDNQQPSPEMDMVGISIRQLPDSGYQVLGVTNFEGKNPLPGIEPGDTIISIDDFLVKGATMGAVVDKLRGKPGELRKIIILKNKKKITIQAKVLHYL